VPRGTARACCRTCASRRPDRTNPVFHTLGQIFSPLVDLLPHPARIHSVIGSWGWAIIILTIIVRLILMPSPSSSSLGAGDARIQPKIKELQRKYKTTSASCKKRP